MCGSVPEVVAEVGSEDAEKPRPRRVPRKLDDVKLFVAPDVQVHLDLTRDRPESKIDTTCVGIVSV